MQVIAYRSLSKNQLPKIDKFLLFSYDVSIKEKNFHQEIFKENSNILKRLMLIQMSPNVVNISLTYNFFSIFVANKLMNTETVSYPSVFQTGEYLYSPKDVMQA